jgi:CRP-like cAMP-binding protein
MSAAGNGSRLLRESPLGDSLDESQIAALANRATRVVLPQSTIVFTEGAPANALRVICSGSVALEMQVPPRGSVRILTLGPGDVLGWSALVGDGHMSATAITLEDVELLAIPAGSLQQLCEEDAEFGRAMMRHVAQSLARRLRETRLQLLDLFAETEPGKAVS